MMSTRYLPVVAVLLAVALVPTVVHTYAGVTASDGKSSGLVAMRLDGVDGIATNRSPGWVADNFGTTDFIERRYGTDVTLFVARGYDPKRLYHHPELGLAWGHSFDSASVLKVQSASVDIPLHTLSGDSDFAAYALLYDDKFIENPMSFQIENAVQALFRPQRPMTLFFARGRATSDPLRSPVVRILVSAIESFHASPGASQ
jgi:hypothetical protein